MLCFTVLGSRQYQAHIWSGSHSKILYIVYDLKSLSLLPTFPTVNALCTCKTVRLEIAQLLLPLGNRQSAPSRQRWGCGSCRFLSSFIFVFADPRQFIEWHFHLFPVLLPHNHVPTMTDEMDFAPISSQTRSIGAGEPQIVSSMTPAYVNADGGKPLPPGETKDTSFSSPSATYTSATMPNRRRRGGIPTRLLRVKIGAGIVRDIRARVPWYWSDWKDAWNYRVIPATALVFFAK